MNTEQLSVYTYRGIPLNLDPNFDMYQKSLTDKVEERVAKMKGLFTRMATEASEDGRVHPVWTFHQDTGLLQCKGPNIYNIPGPLFEVKGVDDLVGGSDE